MRGVSARPVQLPTVFLFQQDCTTILQRVLLKEYDSTGVASGFAGISIADGMVSRIVVLVVGTLMGNIFVTRYAEKVKKDLTKTHFPSLPRRLIPRRRFGDNRESPWLKR